MCVKDVPRESIRWSELRLVECPYRYWHSYHDTSHVWNSEIASAFRYGTRVHLNLRDNTILSGIGEDNLINDAIIEREVPIAKIDGIYVATGTADILVRIPTDDGGICFHLIELKTGPLDFWAREQLDYYIHLLAWTHREVKNKSIIGHLWRLGYDSTIIDRDIPSISNQWNTYAELLELVGKTRRSETSDQVLCVEGEHCNACGLICSIRSAHMESIGDIIKRIECRGESINV